MKKRILFIINGAIEIISDQRWPNAQRPLIIDMDDSHLTNARIWLQTRIDAVRKLKLAMPVFGDFTYILWAEILKKEAERREAVKLQEYAARVERVRISMMTHEEKRQIIESLLDAGGEANLKKAEEIAARCLHSSNNGIYAPGNLKPLSAASYGMEEEEDWFSDDNDRDAEEALDDLHSYNR